MKKKKRARKSRRRRKPNYVRIIICAAVIALAAYFGISAFKIYKLNQEKAEVTAYNEELTKRRESLELKLENINSPEYIESQARSDLKLVKPNELLFIFSEESDSADDSDSTDESNSTDESKSDKSE